MKQVFVLFFLSLFLSCENDNYIDNVDPFEKDALKLSAMGFDTTSLIEKGIYYVVEGDILIHKDSLSRLIITRQYHTTNSVNNEQTITIGVNSIGMLQYWAYALAQVASIYSNHTGLDVTFVGPDASADIVVSYYSDPNIYNYAQGEFPGTSGKPGKNIHINTNAYISLDTELSINQKIFLMMHEVGHNLGLRHSDCFARNESMAAGAIMIPGTPENDTNSFMKSHTGGYSWAGMPYYDKVALRYLFPPYYTISFANTSLSELHAFYSEDGNYILDRNIYPVSQTNTFRGWFNDPNTMSEYNYETMQSNRTFYAKWEAKGEEHSFTNISYNGAFSQSLTLPKTSVVTVTSFINKGNNSWDELKEYDDTYTMIEGNNFSKTCLLSHYMDNLTNEQTFSCSESFVLNAGTYIVTSSITTQLGVQNLAMGNHGTVSLTVNYY